MTGRANKVLLARVEYRHREEIAMQTCAVRLDMLIELLEADGWLHPSIEVSWADGSVQAAWYIDSVLFRVAASATDYLVEQVRGKNDERRAYPRTPEDAATILSGWRKKHVQEAK
jgi:hypothetical protein